MTPRALKRSRHELGLSITLAAKMLGLSPLQIRRMENGTRPVMPTTARLMQAYLDGYRPPDWPEPVLTGERVTLADYARMAADEFRDDDA